MIWNDDNVYFIPLSWLNWKYHIFLWLCVWLYHHRLSCIYIYIYICRYICRYIPVTLGLWSRYWCAVYGVCKWSGSWWSEGCVSLFAHYSHYCNFCRLIWRHWTFKMLVRYMLWSVCLRLAQPSQLSFIQYMGLRVFSILNFLRMIMSMCTLSYYHRQIRSMIH